MLPWWTKSSSSIVNGKQVASDAVMHLACPCPTPMPNTLFAAISQMETLKMQRNALNKQIGEKRKVCAACQQR